MPLHTRHAILAPSLTFPPPSRLKVSTASGGSVIVTFFRRVLDPQPTCLTSPSSITPLLTTFPQVVHFTPAP